MTIPGRIKEIRSKYCAGSNLKFAAIMDESPQTTSNWISGKRSIGLDVIERILGRFPDVNPSWLLTGDGEMLKTGVKEPAPTDFISMPREVFDQINNLIETVKSQQDSIKNLSSMAESLTHIEDMIDKKGAAVQ